MACLQPITAWQKTKWDLQHPNDRTKQGKISFQFKEGWKMIELPCGHCLGCKLDYAKHWSERIMAEAQSWPVNCFITLTYNENNIRRNNAGKATLCERDVQLFLKRLRKEQKGVGSATDKNGEMQKPIRYFYCGEYGTKNHRPHYHIIIFNWKPNDLKAYKKSINGEQLYTSKYLQNLWGLGFAPIGTVTIASAGYVARYCMKKASEEKPAKNIYKTQYIDGIPKSIQYIDPAEPAKEFIRMSRMPGLGYYYFLSNEKKCIRNGGIWVQNNGKPKLATLPRYFSKMLEKAGKWEIDEYIKYEKEKQAKVAKEKYEASISAPTEKNEKYWTIKNNKIKNLIEKAKFLKRNL